MPELLLILVAIALVRSIFFPWGSRAVCNDVLSGIFGGHGGSQPNTNPTPSYTVSPGVSGTAFGQHGGTGGGGVSQQFTKTPGMGATTASTGNTFGHFLPSSASAAPAPTGGGTPDPSVPSNAAQAAPSSVPPLTTLANFLGISPNKS